MRDLSERPRRTYILHQALKVKFYNTSYDLASLLHMPFYLLIVSFMYMGDLSCAEFKA